MILASRSGYVSLALIFVFVCSGCDEYETGGDTADHLSALYGNGEWTLDEMVTEGTVLALDSEDLPAISFVQGAFNGTTGCNHVSGKFSVDGAGAFSLGQIDVTEMACSESLMKQESEFLLCFGKASRLQIKEDALVLDDGTASNSLTFRIKEKKMATFANTTWRLTHFVKTDAETESAESVLEDHKVTFVASDGSISGHGGCNRFNGPIEADENGKLNVGDLIQTKMAGPPEAMNQEFKFLERLPQMKQYVINKQTLTLRSASGDLGLQFQAVTAAD